MLATLAQHLEPPDPSALPDEPLTPTEELEAAVMSGFVSVMRMLSSIRECEYYFRRYPFRGLPVSRSDHLRNCCEMLFDRIAQMRDRLKIALNAIKKQQPTKDIAVGSILKAFEKTFRPVLKLRNQVHHHDRFSDLAVSQLELAELLHVAEALKPKEDRDDDSPLPWSELLDGKTLYQRAARKWVKHVKGYESAAEKFVELIAQLILDECAFIEPYISARDRLRLKNAKRYVLS